MNLYKKNKNLYWEKEKIFKIEIFKNKYVVNKKNIYCVDDVNVVDVYTSEFLFSFYFGANSIYKYFEDKNGKKNPYQYANICEVSGA